MLAIVKETKGRDYAVKDVVIPEITEDEVLIKVKAVGICGTDVPILDGDREVPYPLIPGHEFAGDIVKVGSNVKELKIGDRVTPAIVIGCGQCYFCRKGLETLCDNIVETGIHVDGAFAEYVSVHQKVVHKMPENMTYEQAASIDPIASAYHPIKKANIGSEDTVLIFGPGPIGLYSVQIAKAEGAKQIIVVGISNDKERLELAKEVGADHIFISDGKEDILKYIESLTEGRLADIVIEATGNPAVFNESIRLVRKHGQIILVGIPHKPAEINMNQIVRKEIIIKGSLCYTWDDYKESIDLVCSGRVKVEPLISHKFNLNEIRTAMDKIHKRETIKVILYPTK